MECPHCGFENFGDSQWCARCKTFLDASKIEDIYPPRASDFPARRKIRRSFFSRKINTLKRRLSFTVNEYIRQAIFSFFIPGLGQIAAGRKLKGYLLFAFTVLCLAMFLFFKVGIFANLSLMIALSIHGYSVMDRLRTFKFMRNLLQNMMLSFLIVIGLSFYYRGLRALSMELSVTGNYQFYRVNYNINSLAMRRGDLVMIDMNAYSRVKPQRGDIVIFNGHLNRERYFERIIGVPGDTVEISGGVLRINGVEAEELQYPLARHILPDPFIQNVPDGLYLLLTTAVVNMREIQTMPPDTFSLIPKNDILGRAVKVGNPPFQRQIQ